MWMTKFRREKHAGKVHVYLPLVGVRSVYMFGRKKGKVLPKFSQYGLFSFQRREAWGSPTRSRMVGSPWQ